MTQREIIEKRKKEQGVSTLRALHEQFNEKLGPFGVSYMTFTNWYNYDGGEIGTQANRKALMYAIQVYPAGDWRNQMAGELIGLQEAA